MSADKPVQKREPKRSRIFVKATLSCAGGRQPVRVRDISANGALLESQFPPPKGAVVKLLRGKFIEGRVAWTAGNRFGIEFLSPLDPSELLGEGEQKLRVSAPRAYKAFADLEREPEPVSGANILPIKKRS